MDDLLGHFVATRVARILYCAAMAAALLASACLTAYRVAEPAWEQSHQGYNLSVYGRHVRNLERYGYLSAKAGMIQTWGRHPDPDPLPRYVTHPLLNVTSMFVSSRLFGGHEWALRLPAVVTSVASVFLLAALALRLGGPSAGLVAAVVAALVPIRSEYGRMPDPPMLAAFFAVAAIYSYAMWCDCHRRRWFGALLAAVILGCLSDWNAYFVVPPILMHYFVTHLSTKGMKYPLVLAAAVVVCMAGHVAWVLWNQGTAGLDALRAQFLFRFSSEGYGDAYVFTPLEYFEMLRARTMRQVSPAVVGGSVLWLGSVLARGGRRQRHGLDGVVLVSLAAWLLYVLVFSNVSMIHDYHMLYGAVPFFSLSCAALVSTWSRQLGTRMRVIALSAVFVSLLFFVRQSESELRSYHSQALHVGEVLVGKALNSSSDETDLLLFSSDPPYPRMRYYLDRQFKVVTDSAALESELSAESAPPLYVPDADTDLPDGFRRYLFERFPVEQIESYSVFDLSAQAGNTFGQVPVVEVSSPSSESPLELFDARVSPEVLATAPESHWWERYLNAHPELLPENQIRLTVTYAWRVWEQPDQDYSVVTKLVHVLADEVVLETRREPFSGNLSTTLWRAGEIVREQFELVLPPTASPGRYRLEVELRDSQGKPVPGFEVPPTVLPHFRVAPNSPAVPVGTLPQGCTSLSHTFSPSLELAAYCPGPTHVDLFWRIGEPTEETYAGTLILSAEGLSLEQDVGILAPSDWKLGELYRTRAALSSGILPGQYKVRLAVKGDGDHAEGSVVDLGAHQVGGNAPPVLVRLGQPDSGVERTMRIDPQNPLTAKVSLEEQRDLDLVIAWTGESQLAETRVQVWLDNDTWVWSPKLLRTLALPRGQPSETLVRVPSRLTVAGENRVIVKVARAGEAYLGWRWLAVTLVPNLKHLIRDSYQSYTGWVEADFVDLRLAGQPRNGDELTAVASFYESQGLFSTALKLLEAAMSVNPVEPSSAERLRLARLQHSLGATDQAAQAYRDVLMSISGGESLSDDDREALIEALHNLALLADGPEERRKYEATLRALIPSYSPRLLGETVWYLGHDVAATEQNNSIRLYLIPATAPARDYRVWMHARPDDVEELPEDRKQYGFLNLDHQPEERTSTWVAGRLYVDEMGLDLDDACYDLSFGFWHSQSGERLLLDSGAQGVSIGQVCGGQPSMAEEPASPRAADQFILARLLGALGMHDRAQEHYRAVVDLLSRGQRLSEHDRPRLIDALWHLEGTADAGSSARLMEAVPHYAPVTLGDTLRYLGYDAIVDDGQARLQLYWVPLRPVEGNYRIWMHAVTDSQDVLPRDRRENGFMNLDHNPVQPSSSWVTDEVYVHTHEFGMKEACYTMSFGFWRPEDGARLLTPDGGHGVTLGEVCLD